MLFIHAAKPLNPKEVMCTTVDPRPVTGALEFAAVVPSREDAALSATRHKSGRNTGVVSRDVGAQALPEL